MVKKNKQEAAITEQTGAKITFGEIIDTTNAELKRIFPKGALNRLSKKESKMLNDEDLKANKLLNKQFNDDLDIILKEVLNHPSLDSKDFVGRRIKFITTGFSGETDEDKKVRELAAEKGVEEVVRIGLSAKYQAACCNEFCLIALEFIREMGIPVGIVSVCDPTNNMVYHDLLIINLTEKAKELLENKQFPKLSLLKVVFYDPWNESDFDATDFEEYILYLVNTQCIYEKYQEALRSKGYTIQVRVKAIAGNTEEYSSSSSNSATVPSQAQILGNSIAVVTSPNSSISTHTRATPTSVATPTSIPAKRL